MDRILQNTPATISATFTDQNGTTVDPGSVTVTIYRADGTTLATGAAAGTGATARTYNLTAAQTALLDRLAATWVSATAGTVTTTVEIVGGFAFTVAEARALKPLDQTGAFSNASIIAMRTVVEDAIEEYTGALYPRYDEETLSGVCRLPLLVRKPFVRSVRSIVLDGVALSTSDMANIKSDGTAIYGHAWTTGYGNVVVGFEHGRDRPPERLRRAALLLAKVWLVSGPVDDRTSTLTSDGGTFSLVTPGRGGSIFGVPEVDAAVQANLLPAIA
jgi:hypothetical protein